MSAPLRPLPARPSLAFERKEAKALLRRLRAGDPDALARARERHPAIDASVPAEIKLADAQLVIAREYGFASWPKLVRYFGDVERLLAQPHTRLVGHEPRALYEERVRGWRAALHARGLVVGRALAAYVPRFYGMRVDEVYGQQPTDDELRLAMARLHGCPSWEVLLERAGADSQLRTTGPGWEVSPRERAVWAIRAADLEALRRVTEAHPELLREAGNDAEVGRDLLTTALLEEQKQGQTRLRPIVEWLGAQGFDLQRTLNVHLCGYTTMAPATVRWLLDRGADPNWVAPNGIPVLEHALVRYWNGAAVDALAERAVPREALWVAAGLGDVGGVRRFLDARGKPTREARRFRPDFDAVARRGMLPSLPEPDDEELLMEAFFVALLNGRTALLEYMASHGFPVNSLVWGVPVIGVAIENRWTSVVECLVRCGADLDLQGGQSNPTPRGLARWMVEQRPHDAASRRIAELCGLDPDAIVAERNARPVPPASFEPRLQQALELAGDDAAGLGQSEITPENLLFGLLRGGGPPPLFFTRVSRMDRERFHADQADRLRPAADRVEHPGLPLRPDAQAAVHAAIAVAAERRRAMVLGIHLLYTLLRAGDGAAASVLARYGGDAAAVTAEAERAL
jgi:hypothetical protein